MPLAHQRRTLGRTGLAVSPVGLGCSGFWGHRRFPEQSAAHVVEHALARGVNLLDTGHNYSGFHAEPRLGRILRPLLKRYPRESLVISSKGGTLTGQAGISGAEQRNFSPAAITASCEASLRNLGLDYLDIYQLHGASQHDINDDLLAALQRLRERGLIRHTGINTHTASTLCWMIDHPTLFDVVLLDYNALQQDREPLIDRLHAAIERREVLRFSYRDQQLAETEREVEPLCLAFWGGSWTLGAWCRMRADFRSFRPDRMGPLAAAGEIFEDRAERGLEAYMRAMAVD
mgnify:CR=1 FL=1